MESLPPFIKESIETMFEKHFYSFILAVSLSGVDACDFAVHNFATDSRSDLTSWENYCTDWKPMQESNHLNLP
jgi:hypothetical protein